MTARVGKCLVAVGVLAVPGASLVAQGHDMPMQMQPGAERMKVSIQSPADGSRIAANTVRLRVATTGFHDSCGQAGKPNREGQGHYHVLIDKSLVNMFCTPTATVSLQDVNPPRTTTRRSSTTPARSRSITSLGNRCRPSRMPHEPERRPSGSCRPSRVRRSRGSSTWWWTSTTST